MLIYIYKIYNDEMSYVGSTKNFKKRMITHKSSCNNDKSTKYNYFIYQYIRQNGGWADFKKEIIYECEVDNKTDQKIVEQEWINKNECKLNTFNSYLTDEERKEQMKQWEEKNKDKRKEQMKQYSGQKIICPHCNLEMNKSSLNRHIKRKH